MVDFCLRHAEAAYKVFRKPPAHSEYARAALIILVLKIGAPLHRIIFKRLKSAHGKHLRGCFIKMPDAIGGHVLIHKSSPFARIKQYFPELEHYALGVAYHTPRLAALSFHKAHVEVVCLKPQSPQYLVKQYGQAVVTDIAVGHGQTFLQCTEKPETCA